uniref:OTU domain-containing protein n=1 Tax=Brugia timori TaxID=42155 RepID=A0A0R3QJ68_9BILA
LYYKTQNLGDGTFSRIEDQKLLKSRQYVFTTAGSPKITQVLQNTLYPEIMEANERILLAGSQWRFEQVVWGELIFNTFDITRCGLSGSSYIPLPEKLKNCKGIININNEDNKCFVYSILSYFYKEDRHKRHLISTYRDIDAVLAYIDALFGIKLNFSGLQFPVSLHQVHKFEKNNPRVSVNIFGLINTTSCRLYPLKNVDQEKEFHFDLLYLKCCNDTDDGDDDDDDDVDNIYSDECENEEAGESDN